MWQQQFCRPKGIFQLRPVCDSVCNTFILPLQKKRSRKKKRSLIYNLLCAEMVLSTIPEMSFLSNISHWQWCIAHTQNFSRLQLVYWTLSTLWGWNELEQGQFTNMYIYCSENFGNLFIFKFAGKGFFVHCLVPKISFWISQKSFFLLVKKTFLKKYSEWNLSVDFGFPLFIDFYA